MGDWRTELHKATKKSENEYRSMIIKRLNSDPTDGFVYANNPDRYSNIGIADITGALYTGLFIALELKLIKCDISKNSLNNQLFHKGAFTPNQISFLTTMNNFGMGLGGLILPKHRGKDLLIIVYPSEIIHIECLTVKWALHKERWIPIKELTLATLSKMNFKTYEECFK